MALRRILNHVLVALMFGAFLLLIFSIMNLWALDRAEQENRVSYDELRQMVAENESSDENCIEIVTSDPMSMQILPEYRQLYEAYPGFAGWISIYGTDLSLPVMQEEEDNRNFYLSHDYQGSVTDFGCLYIPYYGSYDSENVIVYGHHMRHQQMFGLLENYQDPSFWEDHRLINYDTPYQHKVYEVFSVMIASVEDSHFRFWGFTDFASPSQAHFYINECVERSLYDMGIVPEDDSKLLTLITCEYSIPNGNGRLVVVARDVTNYG